MNTLAAIQLNRSIQYSQSINNFGSRRIFRILYNKLGDALSQELFSSGGIRPPRGLLVHPSPLHTPDGISIGSAVLTQLTAVTNRHIRTHGHTDTHR